MSAAVVGLIGLFLGLIIRDWLLQLHFFRRKREAELEDQFNKRQNELERIYRAELIGARDVVRLYADPLLRSAKSLNYRLKEVLEQKRRFDIIGYQRFEALFLSTDDATESERRWIRRLDKIFVGLEPHKEDVFDARRNQLRAVYAASTHLQSVLEQKIHEYSMLTETSLSKPTDRVSRA